MSITLSYKESCLLNNNYRALLSKNRTYAGFRQAHRDADYKLAFDYIKDMISPPNSIKNILDPMAGYGSTMRYCQELGANSYQVELNFPAYLWQLLVHPDNKEILYDAICEISKQKGRFIKSHHAQECSGEWFGPNSMEILIRLFEINVDVFREKFEQIEKIEQMALAVLLPFVMRLSTASKSDYTHVKHSGIALLYCYETDYMYYLSFLRDFIYGPVHQLGLVDSYTHDCIYGDAATYEFPQKSFSGMLTSPPYPNYIDYKRMFIVENDFVNLLHRKGYIHTRLIEKNTIGSNIVSGTKGKQVISPLVNSFLDNLASLKLSKKSKYDMDVYYIPYFISYFSDLEVAYENIATALADDFCGYIIVANNNVRSIEVPASDFLIEFWNSKGFTARSIDKKSVAHLGDKNKNSNSRLMARHMEHTIEIKRRAKKNGDE